MGQPMWEMWVSAPCSLLMLHGTAHVGDVGEPSLLTSDVAWGQSMWEMWVNPPVCAVCAVPGACPDVLPLILFGMRSKCLADKLGIVRHARAVVVSTYCLTHRLACDEPGWGTAPSTGLGHACFARYCRVFFAYLQHTRCICVGLEV